MINRNLVFGIIFFFIGSLQAYSPKLTIIILIDQLSHQTFSTIKPHLQGGLKKLLDKGVIFDQAYWPSSMPATATNHAGLATGTVPKNHGIVDNKWLNKKGTIVRCDNDQSQDAVVFSPNGFYKYGKSSHNVMVDTLADQIMMQSDSQKLHKVFALSHKSRSAIMGAGKLGKAVWFDENALQFTSSKAYFKTLPAWLEVFNNQNPIPKTIHWQPVHRPNALQYQASENMNYKYAKRPAMHSTQVPQADYLKTPHAENLLFDIAETCIDHELTDDTNSFFLFLSFSTPDKIGHAFGPHSIEYLDTLYHLDKQLDSFMSFVHKKIEPEKILWVVTSDHGSSPIIETLQEKGYTNARRINKTTLLKNINKKIEKHFDVKQCVKHIDTPDIYFNHKTFDSLSSKTKKRLILYIQHKLMKVPGIKKVWTQHELAMRCFEPHQFEYFYQNQVFPGRSGDLIMEVFPYTLIRKNPKGSGHKTPYRYDTHVPLMFYQKGMHEKKTITTQIWMQQVTSTLAQLLKIPTPSAATFNALPGFRY